MSRGEGQGPQEQEPKDQEPRVDAKVVELLQTALAEALAGKCQAVAIAMLAEGGQYRLAWHGGAWISTMLGLVGHLSHQMNQAMARGPSTHQGTGAGQ